MDKDNLIEEAIIKRLGGHLRVHKPDLHKDLLAELNLDEATEATHIWRIVNLLKDRGQVSDDPTHSQYLRLTDRGVQANRPFIEKTMSYLGDNWIAILALILSIVSLAIDWIRR